MENAAEADGDDGESGHLRPEWCAPMERNSRKGCPWGPLDIHSKVGIRTWDVKRQPMTSKES